MNIVLDTLLLQKLGILVSYMQLLSRQDTKT